MIILQHTHTHKHTAHFTFSVIMCELKGFHLSEEMIGKPDQK